MSRPEEMSANVLAATPWICKSAVKEDRQWPHQCKHICSCGLERREVAFVALVGTFESLYQTLLLY